MVFQDRTLCYLAMFLVATAPKLNMDTVNSGLTYVNQEAVSKELKN